MFLILPFKRTKKKKNSRSVQSSFCSQVFGEKCMKLHLKVNLANLILNYIVLYYYVPVSLCLSLYTASAAWTVLTGSFDGHPQVSTAGILGVHLEVTDLFHSQPWRLETTTCRSARRRDACWKNTHEEVMRRIIKSMNYMRDAQMTHWAPLPHWTGSWGPPLLQKSQWLCADQPEWAGRCSGRCCRPYPPSSPPRCSGGLEGLWWWPSRLLYRLLQRTRKGGGTLLNTNIVESVTAQHLRWLRVQHITFMRWFASRCTSTCLQCASSHRN